MRKLEKLEESIKITEATEKLEEEPGIERIARKMEIHELANDSNINLRIESKKLFLVLQNILAIEKTLK